MDDFQGRATSAPSARCHQAGSQPPLLGLQDGEQRLGIHSAAHVGLVAVGWLDVRKRLSASGFRVLSSLHPALLPFNG